MNKLRHHILQWQTLRAVLFIVFGYICLSVSDTTTRYLRLLEYPSLEIILFNSIFGAVYLYCLYHILPQKGRGLLKTENLKKHIIRGFFLATTGIAITYALYSLNLAELYTVLFLYPLLVCVLSVIFLKEDIRWVRWSVIVIGFFGVLISINPSDNHFGQPAILAALWAAFSYAIGLVMTKMIGHERNIFRLAIIPMLCLFPIALISLLITGGFIIPAPEHWLLFLFTGCMMASGLYCISAAYTMVRASMLAPFGYSQIIWGSLLGYFIFGDLTTTRVYIGSIVIIASGLFVFYREQYLIKNGILEKRYKKKKKKELSQP